ncbi:MAG TPA: hypothetical protein VNL77_16025 [Roseiflexaceae bacterium]|nr:hypothetical protein [Roseiflexaceae bacterium]
MKVRSLAIAAALVAGLALGALLGPSLQASVASAQAQPTPQPQGTQAAQATPLWSQFLDQLAAALNIQRSTLDSAIVTAANNTADAAVQQGRLTQAQADALKARVQAGDFGPLFGGRRGPKGLHALAGLRQAMLDAAAKTLGITTDELVTQLRAGQTVAQLAQAHGTTEQAVVDAALAAAKSNLDAAVAAGRLTQAQADTIYTHLQQQGTQLFVPHGRGRGWHGAPRTAPGTTPTPVPGTDL